MSALDTAFTEGYRAYEIGKSFDSNPYPVGTFERSDWNDGYNAAADDNEYAD